MILNTFLKPQEYVAVYFYIIPQELLSIWSLVLFYFMNFKHVSIILLFFSVYNKYSICNYGNVAKVVGEIYSSLE